ncbi:MAG TPA: hypothetical protein DCS09_12765 [Porphyromonadaceae bacterium]|nr:hypothetical protein [Porphyromonadaceae bacterium]
MRYASNTAVSEDRSRAEIEQMLMKYGADEFGYITRATEAMIGFQYKGIRVQMTVPLPSSTDKRFHETPTGRQVRSDNKAFDAWQKEIRRRWRSLCLVIKAMLVGVDDGVMTFEQAFMPYMVLGNGQTVAHYFLPGIQKAIKLGTGLGSMKQLAMLP